MSDTCMNCKWFRVPDDGKIWGLSGVCDNDNNVAGASLIWSTMDASLLAGDLWELPCGALVVKEYYYCQWFEHNIEYDPDDCFFYG